MWAFQASLSFVLLLVLSIDNADAASNFHKHVVQEHSKYWSSNAPRDDDHVFEEGFEGYWASVGLVNVTGVRQMHAMWHSSLSEFVVSRWEVADGYHHNEVHVYFEWSGVFTGVFQGVRGDGRPISVRGNYPVIRGSGDQVVMN
jgi:hypothetical protein